MQALKIASMTLALAAVAALPATACDYSHEANKVTASAIETPAAETQAAADVGQPAAAEAAKSEPTQTAETATTPAPQPKLN